MVVAAKKFLRKYFKNPSGRQEQPPEHSSEHALQIATAALLIATMGADGEAGEDERRTVVETIRSRFDLTRDETNDLLALAEQKSWKSSGYYEFTADINKTLRYEDKVKIIEHLWEVAFADARVDKHEDHEIRKIASLLFVEHKDFIGTKLKVKRHALNRKSKAPD